jgi:hypothetical protein
MLDAIERYLDEVLSWADLAVGDEWKVRQELAEHLHALAASAQTSNPKEVYAMLSDQFGKPKRIGKQVARAKGRLRTYWKKSVRKLPLRLAVCLLLALAVRHSVAEEFYAASDAAAPMIPRGSRMLVYKLARSFQAGDVIVFRHPDGHARMGTVKSQNPSGEVIVSRIGHPDEIVPLERVVGRVVLNTR